MGSVGRASGLTRWRPNSPVTSVDSPKPLSALKTPMTRTVPRVVRVAPVSIGIAKSRICSALSAKSSMWLNRLPNPLAVLLIRKFFFHVLLFSTLRSSIPATSPSSSSSSSFSLDPKIAAQLELARQKANQVALRGGLSTAGASKLGGIGGAAAGVVPNASRTAAELAAERLNAKLGYSKSSSSASLNSPDGDDEGTGTSTDFTRRYALPLPFFKMISYETGLSLSRYEEELEINDFPQNVRWRITGRDLLAHLNEYCDVGVSVRGVYMPPGGGKGSGAAAAASAAAALDGGEERPLYLCLEATNERSIQLAKSEIMRIIKEELVKLVRACLFTR